mmetsp:Transcript_2543/g.4590  ORF Transcript_2543/g.4590 Transcript_2543/m.4590 type:complete len:165 (+) Transcript_2543:392-886(+)
MINVYGYNINCIPPRQGISSRSIIPPSVSSSSKLLSSPDNASSSSFPNLILSATKLHCGDLPHGSGGLGPEEEAASQLRRMSKCTSHQPLQHLRRRLERQRRKRQGRALHRAIGDRDGINILGLSVCRAGRLFGNWPLVRKLAARLTKLAATAIHRWLIYTCCR